ncbi:MAG: efflux RND transporter permease subunit [Gammaproteobacteria bacterium]|nr:efflux RND transporter permease subunit [Gammaproteobacteria bacterium]
MNDVAAGGLIAVFGRHRVAGNLLMILMILFGIWGLTQLNRQVMPDINIEIISVLVQWPGASPEDVESNIITAIESEVRFINGVDRVEAIAFEGRAEVTIEFESGVNIGRALADVQSAVARIRTFPADIERPIVNQFDPTDPVCRIEISGPFPERALKAYARRIRDDLLNLGMDRVTPLGMRDTEIWVELQPEVLRRLDLTVADIARRLQESSLDLPSGSIEGGGMSRQIRSESLARTAADVGEIEVVSRVTGERLRLRDIGRIYETFEESSVSNRLDGTTSIGLQVLRSPGDDSIETQRRIVEYLEELRKELPATLQVDMFDVFADQVTQRVRMLLRNCFGGLVLVLLVLFLFLNVRVAFWVAMGIPIAVMAAFGGMALLGITLNMISMFAIIMGLGIIVDDAIVVAEHTEMLHRRGVEPQKAALQAAGLMFAPVVAASLTTIAAVFPILTVGAIVGRVVRELPLVIILVIATSLVECFLILPTHLRHALRRLDKSSPNPGVLNKWLVRFRAGRFTRMVSTSFENRYSTLVATLCAFALAFSLLMSGRVGFEFFASPQTDIVFANFAMTPGTPRNRADEMLNEIARALRVVEKDLAGEGELVLYGVGTIGTTGGRLGEGTLSGDHVGYYTAELVSGDIREVRNTVLMEAWEAEIQSLAGVERLTLFEQSAGGPPGRDLDIRLYGAELPVLKAAAEEIAAGLRQFPGTLAVEDNLPYGKEEIVLDVTSAGRAMGFSTQSVARQVRDAFEGAIARRFAEDQEEVIVRVKLAESANAPDTIRDLYLQAPDGTEVPLTEVATLSPRVGFSQIRRDDGRREVSVTADIDTSVTTSNVVLAEIERDLVPRVSREYGVDIAFKGKAEEQTEALGDTAVALGIALATIYIILAWLFASYTTPLVVMSVIPFGLVGAFFGHWVMGFNLNMLSLMALLGLAGVMVNDSIIMISTVRRLHADGRAFDAAVIGAAQERLRPVILTTLTTIGGLTPLLFEGSVQAQLIQPLAVSMIFGLMFSPFLVLFFVPSMLGIGRDLRQSFGKLTSSSQPGSASSTSSAKPGSSS